MCVAAEPTRLGALHGAVSKLGSEILVAQCRQISERTALHRRARSECIVPRLRRSHIVVGADLLADIAAQYPCTHCVCNPVRDRRTRLDRMVCDAETGIKDARSDESLGWTCIETASAFAAVWLCLGVGNKLNIHEQPAQQDVRPVAAVDEHRVLADPAEPRTTGQFTLQHCRSVAERPGAAWLADQRRQLIGQASQPCHHPVVVVVVERVPREPASSGLGRVQRYVAACRDHHRRARTWQMHGGVEAALDVGCHISHACVVSRVEPRHEVLSIIARRGGRDAHEIEAELDRTTLDAMLGSVSHE